MEDHSSSRSYPASALHGRATEGGVKLEGALDHESREGREAAFDAWSARKKRELGFFAGLTFNKMNPPTIGWAFSRHWPHLLCWQWSVWLTTVRPEYDGPPGFWFRRGHKQWRLRIWGLELSWHHQNYDRIAAIGRRWRHDAPVIHVHRKSDRDDD
jgi:hypothetical protein